MMMNRTVPTVFGPSAGFAGSGDPIAGNPKARQFVDGVVRDAGKVARDTLTTAAGDAAEDLVNRAANWLTGRVSPRQRIARTPGYVPAPVQAIPAGEPQRTPLGLTRAQLIVGAIVVAVVLIALLVVRGRS